VERGVTSLPGGQYILANSLQIADGNFVTGTFAQTFAGTPVVIPTTVTNLTSSARAVRFNNINGSTFQVRTQFNESGMVATDDIITVNYIAMLPGRYTIDDLTLEAGLTANTVTHQPFNLTFQQPFGGTPVFVANIQTFNDADPAALRLNSLSSTAANFFIQEDTSFDLEIQHGNEQVGYVALYRGSGDGFRSSGTSNDLASVLWLPDLSRDNRSSGISSEVVITKLQWPAELFGQLLLEDSEVAFGRGIEINPVKTSEPMKGRQLQVETNSSRVAKLDDFFDAFDMSIQETVKSRLV
jgi:hypothetical protein